MMSSSYNMCLFLSGATIGALLTYYLRFKRKTKNQDDETQIPKYVLDDNCVFCSIVMGRIPCKRVIETEKVLGFVDIFPLSKGHCMVIPKYHAMKLNQVPEDYLRELGPAIGKLGKAIIEVTGVSDYNVLQNNGSNAHQTISHVHFHVIPKPSLDEGLGLSWPSTKGTEEELEKIGREIYKRVKSSSPSISAEAVCTIKGEANGEILFKQASASEPVHITGTINGLKPGKHGFHIHTYGDLSDGCLSTGSHFNPFKNDHGGPNDFNRHMGDLGNIKADHNGIATINITDHQTTLFGPNTVIGRAVVVHADKDDLGKGIGDSLITGNAGDRIGCGIIAIKK